MASAERAAGNPEAAQRALERAIELDDDSAQAHRELAAIHQQAGRNQQAQLALVRAIELAPRDAGSKSELAQLLREDGDELGALELLRSNDKQGRGSAEDLRVTAEILHGQGDDPGATQALTRAIELRPERPRLRVELAELILQLLAKQREDRVQSAEEVATRLQQMLGGS